MSIDLSFKLQKLLDRNRPSQTSIRPYGFKNVSSLEIANFLLISLILLVLL